MTNRIKRIVLGLFVAAIIAASGLVSVYPSIATQPVAQAQVAAPTLTARDAAVGQVIVEFTPTTDNTRIGWANIDEVQAAEAAGNWLTAFTFSDQPASPYTVKRLEPGVQHAFIPAALDTNGQPVWGSWIFHTPAAAPTPTPATCQPPVLTQESPQVFEGAGDLLYSDGRRVHLTPGRYEVVTELLGEGRYDYADPDLQKEGEDEDISIRSAFSIRGGRQTTSFVAETNNYRNHTGVFRLVIDASDEDVRWRVTIRKTDDF